MRTADLIAKRFGIQTSINVNPLIAQVGTTALQVLSNNPNRLAWTIVNLSNNNMWCGFDSVTSSSKGVFLSPNGGSATMSMDEDFEAVCWEIWIIASAATSNLWTSEVLIASEYAG